MAVKGLTQDALARMLKMDVSQLNRTIAFHRPVTVEERKRWAKALRVHPPQVLRLRVTDVDKEGADEFFERYYGRVHGSSRVARRGGDDAGEGEGEGQG